MGFWAVAQTEHQREKTAKRFLEDDGYTVFLPLTYTGQLRQRLTPLFPSYLFVEIETRFYSIEHTVGVIQLLKSGDAPAAVPEKEIRKLKRQQRDGVIRLPRRETEIGDAFRVLRGPFEGFDGLYDGLSGADRVWILLNLLGAQRRTEFQKQDVRAL